MTDPLTAAVRRYRAAKEAVVAARERLAEAQREVRRARKALHAAVVAEVKNGARQQSEIAETVGVRREQVRRIARAAGIEPD